MAKNIYLHELRMQMKSVMTWSLSIVVMMLLFFSLFPSFAKEAELMNQLMSRLPPEFLAAFGMTGMDFSTVLGFYGFLFTFVQVCLAIQASNYGVGLVSIEEGELTADFLLTKPVSRSKIMTSKLVAAFTSMSITTLVIWLGSFVTVGLFNGDRSYDAGILMLLLVSLFIFQWVFLSLGLFISLLIKRVRNITPYALVLGFGMYALSAFSGIQGDVKLELVTPFKHFDPNYIIQHNAYDMPLVLISVTVIIVSIVVSYWRYIRRDIAAAV